MPAAPQTARTTGTMPVSGVIMTSDRRGVFCRRLMSAACSLNCEYFDLLSAAVARNRMPSAPRLAPRVYLHVGSEVDGERARARQLGIGGDDAGVRVGVGHSQWAWSVSPRSTPRPGLACVLRGLANSPAHVRHGMAKTEGANGSEPARKGLPVSPRVRGCVRRPAGPGWSYLSNSAP